jgi:membrane protease YdiL (CAAX protease family)
MITLRRAYIPHETLVGPARARPEFWRIPVGLGLIVVVAMLLSSGLGMMIATLFPRAVTGQQGAMGQTPGTLLMLLSGFIFITIATGVALRLLHNRGLPSLLGPAHAVLRDFRAVLVGLVLLGIAVAVLPPYDTGAPLTPNLPPLTWALLLPFSLLALLIQTSAEEILFRGYLQQQLAARFSSPLVWMIVPSVLFAFGHYVPVDAGDNALLVAAWAGVFGLLMADLTARAGNLGPAIAVHFANNLSAILLVSLPDSLSGLSLYTIDIDISDAGARASWMPIDFGMMILMWLTARLMIRR